METFFLVVVAKVCFTAVADKGEDYGPFSANRTLVFEIAVTNAGNAYDPTSGKYITLFFHTATTDVAVLNKKVLNI